MPKRLPLLILAGSDPQPGPAPAGLAQDDMLSGFKAVYRLPSGVPLISELIQRFNASGRFEQPILIGPRRVHEGIVDCEIVDVEGSLATTLEHTYKFITRRFHHLDPVAISACDILPTPDEIRSLLETNYDPHEDAQFWWQLVDTKPESLNVSSWKQSYQLRPDTDQPPMNLYPGHLVIVRVGALRMRVVNSVLQIAYWYRNRDLRTRHVHVAIESFRRLLAEDIRSLTSLRLPLFSISIPIRGLLAYYKMVRKQLTLREFEHHVAKTLVRRAFHKSAQGRPVRFTVTPILAFAKDIDTKAELAEAGS
ncbi:MAG TPA: hypothetical protein EYO39_00565 [Nitrospirales bacterium]|nr:hypothetical protein [Nitrospirales bacterium]